MKQENEFGGHLPFKEAEDKLQLEKKRAVMRLKIAL